MTERSIPATQSLAMIWHWPFKPTLRKHTYLSSLQEGNERSLGIVISVLNKGCKLTINVLTREGN